MQKEQIQKPIYHFMIYYKCQNVYDPPHTVRKKYVINKVNICIRNYVIMAVFFDFADFGTTALNGVEQTSRQSDIDRIYQHFIVN